MSWFASAFIALLTAALGALASGYVANLSVDWYHISSREGGAGYYVLAFGLLGLIVGLILGLVTSRIVASGADPTFIKALSISLGSMLILVGIVGGSARLLADVPPEIDGETLLLAVEIRWPDDQVASPASFPGEGYLRLHSVPSFSHTVRASARGPLWKEDAKQVEGRWVVPGAVEIFTSRGSRSLEVNLGADSSEGFGVPLPGYPGKKDMEWSDWLPRDGRGGPPRATGITYRYRAQRWSEPIRTQAIGAFEVVTIASGFWEVPYEGKSTSAAVARFRVRHAGQPVVMPGAESGGDSASAEEVKLDEVAQLPGTTHALVVHTDPDGAGGDCFLLADDGGTLRVERLAACGGVISSQVVTTDTARFRSAKRIEAIRGRINTVTFPQPDVYLIGNNTLDTRTLVSHHFTINTAGIPIPSVPPLTRSPDGRSIVRFCYGVGEDGISSEDRPNLLVINVVTNQNYLLPIDVTRMRFADFDALDPAWVDHHFVWERASDGADRLVERKHFVPIPYHGVVREYTGGDNNYRIEKAGHALRMALIDFLVAQFKGERMPGDTSDYEIPVRIDGRVVKVAASSDFGYVAVSMDAGAGDTSLVARIGERFNAELATGRYDKLFAK